MRELPSHPRSDQVPSRQEVHQESVLRLPLSHLMRLLFVAVITLLLSLNHQSSYGQAFPPTSPKVIKPPKAPKRTYLDMEILIPRNGTGSIAAQKWGKTLEQLNQEAIFRIPRIGDKPGLTEKMLGGSRWVTVIAQLDSKGRLIIENKKFTLTEIEEFKNWMADIKLFGAQGNPNTQPVWGLSKLQYDDVYMLLSKPVQKPVKDQLILDALSEWENLPEHPLSFTKDAKTKLVKFAASQPVKQEVKGLSKGTALAILLNEYGLCFYPRRTPEKVITLTITPIGEGVKPWQFGYDLEKLKVQRLKAAPSFFKVKVREYYGAPLEKVISDLREETKIPIFIDYAAAASYRINLSEAKVNYPRRHASASLLLKAAAFQAKLSYKLRIDEAGNTFALLKVFDPKIK